MKLQQQPCDERVRAPRQLVPGRTGGDDRLGVHPGGDLRRHQGETIYI